MHGFCFVLDTRWIVPQTNFRARVDRGCRSTVGLVGVDSSFINSALPDRGRPLPSVVHCWTWSYHLFSRTTETLVTEIWRHCLYKWTRSQPSGNWVLDFNLDCFVFSLFHYYWLSWLHFIKSALLSKHTSELLGQPGELLGGTLTIACEQTRVWGHTRERRSRKDGPRDGKKLASLSLLSSQTYSRGVFARGCALRPEPVSKNRVNCDGLASHSGEVGKLLVASTTQLLLLDLLLLLLLLLLHHPTTTPSLLPFLSPPPLPLQAPLPPPLPELPPQSLLHLPHYNVLPIVVVFNHSLYLIY